MNALKRNVFLQMLKKRWGVLFFLTVLLLVLETRPIVQTYRQSSLTPEEVKLAKSLAKSLISPLASNEQFVEVQFNRSQFDAVSKLATYTFEDVFMKVGFNRFGAIAAISYQPVSWLNLNLRCEFNSADNGLNYCYAGDLPIPSAIVKSISYLVLSLVFDQEVAKTFSYTLQHISFNDNYVSIKVEKAKDFKHRVKSSISTLASVTKSVRGKSSVNHDEIKFYLDEIASLPKNNELGFYIHHLMRSAQLRSVEQDPVEQNTAVIWALALSFATDRFADLIDYPRGELDVRAISLRGRQDHSLHFLFSAILEQVGTTNVGLKIGELKELLDANSGGSGYSFPDLAADMAGVAFAKYTTENKVQALRAQSILAAQENDFLFFPPAHDLPEGLGERSFNEFIGGTGSKSYSNLYRKIERRIEQSALYMSANQGSAVPYPLLATNQESRENGVFISHASSYKNIALDSDTGKWLIIDTHIHSSYSDGAHSVNDIAEKANQFGCDAIAFTDHGDGDLKHLFNDDYFTDLSLADTKYPNMTIIRGMEWNIPPFKGREHVTVLYPQLDNYPLTMKNFRSKFDNYKNWRPEQNEIVNAFAWLVRNASSRGQSPVIIYNHPSRKDFLAIENAYDFAYWSRHSDLVIGFSGAPGHQKKRSDNNGSYETRLKTIHGWDPVVAEVAGTWDTLLMNGHKVWGARAASDFHNTKMDYWPCEFSSTHTFAKSGSSNDIISSLQAGRTWAQHGRFVKSFDFHLKSAQGEKVEMGQTLVLNQGEALTIEVEIVLNDQDFQGFDTSLDDIGIVFITENDIEVEQKFPERYMRKKTFRLSLNKVISSKRLALRVFARSIQPEQHHYMMYSNPIIVETR